MTNHLNNYIILSISDNKILSIKNKISAANISKHGTSKNNLKTALGTLNQKI